MDHSQRADLIVRPTYDAQLRSSERALLQFLNQHGLPTDSVFVPVEERLTVFSNVDRVISRLDTERLQRSGYISKFMAAVASGLADAALNYLWDETIFELRRRVAQYDLSYFYDNAVRNEEKRKKLNTEEDLAKIDDSELILGAKEIGLISELGYRHLDFIRFNRNWASAAHPNQNELTGLQLISWLETCVREVIALPLSDIAIEIRRLLANIRDTSLSDAEARAIGTFFLNLSQDQANNLAAGFFGMYTRSDTTVQTRQNIRALLPLLWERVDEVTRYAFGTKYGRFVANNDQKEKDLARQFLETVAALAYIPDGLRAAEIETAIENLLMAHRGFNNFYSEPPFARELQRLVGTQGHVPPQVVVHYVLALVEVYLTNGHGVSWNAEPVYCTLLDQLDAEQALVAILSFTSTPIASRLQFHLCQQKFNQVLDMMSAKVSATAVKELIADVQAYTGPAYRLKDDDRIKRKVAYLQTILGHRATSSI